MEKTKLSLRVLIVEDDTSIGFYFKRILLHQGHTVTLAASGDKAKDFYNNKTADIVICDHVLPGGNGAELMKWIKERFPQTYCILISGYYNESFKKYLSPDCADEVSPKPVTREMIDMFIENYIRSGKKIV